MGQVDHSFDWKGFYFFIKIAAVSLLIGSGGHYGLLQFTRAAAPAPTPVVVAQETLPSVAAAREALSSSTPQRVINTLTIADTVPAEGKFIAADLVTMEISLYQDGVIVSKHPIQTKGKPGTAWETPSGFYSIQTKEVSHFSTIGKVYMPYSMQFYGNYFIHGWTYYPDGTPTAASFSGGCIKLLTEDAKKVFEFADLNTKLFVYDSKQTAPPAPLSLGPTPVPTIGAAAYLVADLDTSDVYMEQDATAKRPIASVTKLMTALVANETISFDKKIAVLQGELVSPQNMDDATPKTFLIGDLLHPLLMQSNNAIADSLASYYGSKGFVRWMNVTAQALGMTSTTFADPSGKSPENISTPEDLFRLAVYLSNKKSFVFKITQAQTKTITAQDGSTYRISNVNSPAFSEPFAGGKAGHTTAAKDTMLSVMSFEAGGETRRVAVIVLGSENQIQDTKQLAQWVLAAAKNTSGTACATCALPQYRKIAP